MSVPECVILEDRPCPLGCPVGDEKVLQARDRLNDLPGTFTVVRCKTCGLMRTNPRPTLETIGFYYPDDYGPYQNTVVKSLDKALMETKPLWKQTVRRIFEFNTEVLPSVEVGRMLEVGCASGAFLHKMAQKGWEVEGIEFSPKAAEMARSLGYRVITSAVESAPDPGQPYDLIVGWMVLEHLHEPIEALKKLWQWAKPGGWLVISIPNAASLEFRFFKDRWYALQLPNHLYHYTPDTAYKILQAGGWRIERILHQRILNNVIASIGYVLQDHRFLLRLAKALIEFPKRPTRLPYVLYPLAYMLAPFGQTGRMTVWARKDAQTY